MCIFDRLSAHLLPQTPNVFISLAIAKQLCDIYLWDKQLNYLFCSVGT